MLGKLIKYEFKNTAKVMLTIYSFVAVIATLGTVAFALMDPDVSTAFTDFVSTSLLILYGLSIFALFIVTYIYVCVHFYKTMYSDQGYLTHTLPVSPVTTFHVKLLVSFCWMMGALILLILSVFMLLMGATHSNFFTDFSAELRAELIVEFNTVFSVYGLSFGEFWAFIGFSIVIGCISYLLMVYASMSIGQLFNQNKIGFSIVAGIAIYFIEQILNTALLLILGFSKQEILFGESEAMTDAAFVSFWSTTTWASSLLSIFFMIVLYIICHVIVKKHINLD